MFDKATFSTAIGFFHILSSPIFGEGEAIGIFAYGSVTFSTCVGHYSSRTCITPLLQRADT
jgi:hypothetical protein